MGLHFTQGMRIRRTGFGNMCAAELGVPTPIANEVMEGSRLVSFDEHPYISKSGYGSPGGHDFPEQALVSCEASMTVTLTDGDDTETSTVLTADFTDAPAYWDVDGLGARDNVATDESVFVDDTLTTVSFQADYGSTVYASFYLPRVVFQTVTVEKDGVEREFRNVACLPLDGYRNASASYRMGEDTGSWGSSDQRYLTIPELKRRVE